MMVTAPYAKMWKGLIERLLAFALPESLQPIPKSHHGPQGPRLFCDRANGLVGIVALTSGYDWPDSNV
jgi:hypothetical protein